jgi:hypothetical protein
MEKQVPLLPTTMIQRSVSIRTVAEFSAKISNRAAAPKYLTFSSDTNVSFIESERVNAGFSQRDTWIMGNELDYQKWRVASVVIIQKPQVILGGNRLLFLCTRQKVVVDNENVFDRGLRNLIHEVRAPIYK